MKTILLLVFLALPLCAAEPEIPAALRGTWKPVKGDETHIITATEWKIIRPTGATVEKFRVDLTPTDGGAVTLYSGKVCYRVFIEKDGQQLTRVKEVDKTRGTLTVTTKEIEFVLVKVTENKKED